MARKLEYKLSKGLKGQILNSIENSGLRFEGEVTLKGTNLLRGEYSECCVPIQGFAHASPFSTKQVDFVIYDGCCFAASHGAIYVSVNRNLELDQTIRLIVLSIANHEYYEI